MLEFDIVTIRSRRSPQQRLCKRIHSAAAYPPRAAPIGPAGRPAPQAATRASYAPMADAAARVTGALPHGNRFRLSRRSGRTNASDPLPIRLTLCCPIAPAGRPVPSAATRTYCAPRADAAAGVTGALPLGNSPISLRSGGRANMSTPSPRIPLVPLPLDPPVARRPRQQREHPSGYRSFWERVRTRCIIIMLELRLKKKKRTTLFTTLATTETQQQQH